MLSFKPLILLVVLPSLHCTNHLDWCQYWRALHKDHVKPECNGLYRLRFSKLQDETNRQLPPLNRELLGGFHRYKSQVSSTNKPVIRIMRIEKCSASFSSCKSSSICESGLLCQSRVNRKTCCAPIKKMQKSFCPTPLEMIGTCFASQPSDSKCTSNMQCSASNQKCCPTMCGFSVCARKNLELLSK